MNPTCVVRALPPWRGALVLLAATLLWTTPARAGCETAVQEWAQRAPPALCHLRPIVCPPGGVVVEVLVPSNPPLRVELRRAASEAFRIVRGVSLSPVLEVASWADVPTPVREAFDGLARCIEKHPEPFPLDVGGAPAPASTPVSTASAPPTHAPATHTLPWRLLLGLTLGILACARRVPRHRAVETTAALVGLPTFSAVLWSLFYARGFLHPNGQGPAWVHYALDPSVERSPYGSGFAELFGALAASFPSSPEHVIFAANTALSATVPLATWWIARRALVPRGLAWALACVVGVLPALGREAQSQSYYACATALLALGAMILVSGPRHPGTRLSWARAVFATVGAGLVIAQAVRIHPICWTAAAITPLVVVSIPGRARTTLIRLVLTTFGVAVTVWISTGAALLAVQKEAVGAQWATRGIDLLVGHLLAPTGFGVVAIAMLGLLRQRRLAALFAIATVASLFAGARLIDGDPAVYQRGFELLFLGSLLGPVCVLLAWRGPARTGTAIAIWSVAAFSAFSAWYDARLLSTNSVEQENLIALRGALPAGATLVSLSRAGRRVFLLPLYGEESTPPLRAFPLRAGDPVPRELGRDTYYYRSSLCDTNDGRDACAAFESAWTLVPIAERTLEARPSKAEHPYPHDQVKVGLFRVEPRPSTDHANHGAD